MSPTVAAASTSLHRSSSAASNSITPSSDASKKRNGEPRLLPQWTSPKTKTSQPKTKSRPVTMPPTSSGTGSPAAAKAVATTGKKRKRSSPFRIKVGCIVALRHRPTGNHVALVSPTGSRQTILGKKSNSYAEVWADPLRGRDEGFALVGRRIRCCFPKSVLSEDQKEKRASSRILEGEIVSLVDYQSQWILQRKRRRRRVPCNFVVEMLVDRASLAAMPFLNRTDEAVSTEKLSEVEKKRLRYEEIIKGENKVMVQVTLSDTSRISNEAEGQHHESNKGPVARWVIRKRVPLPLFPPTTAKNGGEKTGAKSADGIEKSGEMNIAVPADDSQNRGEKNGSQPSGELNVPMCETGKEGEKNVSKATENTQVKKRPVATSSTGKPAKRRKANGKKSAATGSATKYLGNGNDSPAQQERNLRWLAGRYYDMQKLGGAHDDTTVSDILSSGLVGEVLRVMPTATSNTSSTLATVTIRKLIIPEYTRSGRTANHGPFDIFDDSDSLIELADIGDSKGKMLNANESALAMPEQKFYTFQVPVEELVIISRRFERKFDPSFASNSGTENIGHPLVFHSYSSRSDSFAALVKPGNVVEACASDDSYVCHRCRKLMPSSKMKPCLTKRCGMRQSGAEVDSAEETWWCEKCLSVLESTCPIPVGNDEKWAPPCCRGFCDCRCCTASGMETSIPNIAQEVPKESDRTVGTSQFASTCSLVRNMCQASFQLPSALLELWSLPIPSDTPVSRVQKRVLKKHKKDGQPRKAAGAGKRKGKQSEPSLPLGQKLTNDVPRDDEHHVFRPTCSRLLPYDQEKKRFSGVPKQQVTRAEDLSVGREVPRRSAAHGDARQKVRVRGNGVDRSEKKTTNRAARANQRRIMKDVAAFGAAGLGLDALAGREQQLRFDKSLIHAWGVFADEEISTGEMIVEYRGELIGNAVAEKREIEYEKAKIGSDYMFRIDAHMVCDATKQGNVARFINASCNPNCYTQIITLNGAKRIVIYAKRDIQPGEELCYDYKFPLEFDESKRIRCGCGAPDCRGFMNWDKKYVALPAPSGNSPDIPKGKAL